MDENRVMVFVRRQREFWLTAEGKTQHLQPGDSLQVRALLKHKEKYGVEGCVFWVARV